MGSRVATEVDLNWDVLGLPSVYLTHLDEPFTMQVLKKAVDDLHWEKGLGRPSVGCVESYYVCII